jgi:hypothetical protein
MEKVEIWGGHTKNDQGKILKWYLGISRSTSPTHITHLNAPLYALEGMIVHLWQHPDPKYNRLDNGPPLLTEITLNRNPGSQ